MTTPSQNCDKEAFTSEVAAKRALKAIRVQKPGHPGRASGKRPLRHYRCPWCDQWHLTSSKTDRRRRYRP